MYLRRETYFAILLDREHAGPVLVASPMGGMDIEQVAHNSPNQIFKEAVDIHEGIQPAQVERLTTSMGFKGKQAVAQATALIKNLYKLFIETDATLVEINPLCETHDARVLCVDAKFNFDDNAAFRHADLFALRDPSQEDPREVAADKAGLNYIQLDGNIGCLVNGAGLAMATMDCIKLHGGSPANFLDIGGGASAQQVTQAFKLLNADPQVKAILVNIFGGIMRCDVIALGLISAVTELGIKKPLVVRLAGTNVSEAKKLIEESGLRMLSADDLEDASTKVVRIVEILKMAEAAHVQVSFEIPL
jgi:succinyl-CoA synthetase beta subunit